MNRFLYPVSLCLAVGIGGLLVVRSSAVTSLPIDPTDPEGAVGWTEAGPPPPCERVSICDTPSGGKNGQAYVGAGLIWQTDYSNAQIILIDTANNCNVVQSCPVPSGEPSENAFDGEFVYHYNFDTGLLYKIDPATCDIVAECNPPGDDMAEGLTWDGEFLWKGDSTTLYRFTPPPDCTVVATCPNPAGDSADGLAMCGEFLIMLGYSGNLYQIDPVTCEVVGTCNLNAGPTGDGISSDAISSLFVDQQAGFIDVVDADCSAPADLDIKPGSCPNSYNRNSHGVLPVALVGTTGFDVSQVDVDSLLLVRTDGGGGSVAPNFGPPGPHPTIDDVATPFEAEECECHEATGDGIDDLMMHFRTDDVVANLDLNSFPPGAFISLTLTGTLLDGSEFEVSDCVRLVPPGTPPGLLAVTSNLPGVWIDLTPPDNAIDQGGFANFVRSYPLTTEVTLTAPSEQLGWVFVGWNVFTAPGPVSSNGPAPDTGDEVNTLIRSRSVTLSIETALEVVEAVYEPVIVTPTGNGPDPYNSPPSSHRGDDGIDEVDAPNDPADDPVLPPAQEDPPSSPGIPRR